MKTLILSLILLAASAQAGSTFSCKIGLNDPKSLRTDWISGLTVVTPGSEISYFDHRHYTLKLSNKKKAMIVVNDSRLSNSAPVSIAIGGKKSVAIIDNQRIIDSTGPGVSMTCTKN